MFKISPIFAIIAMLIFLLKPEDNNATEKPKTHKKEVTDDDYEDDDDDFDYDNYDDIDLDGIDYEDLLELERQLSSLSDFKSIKQQVESSMEKKQKIPNTKPNLNDELTEDDLKKGFKIKNMKKLGEFDAPDDMLDDEDFPDELKEQIRSSKSKTKTEL